MTHLHAVELRHDAVPGRVRVRLPTLRGVDAAALEARLRATPGILAASANTLTGSVLLHHGAVLSTEDVMRLVAGLHRPAPAGPVAPTDATPWHALPTGALLDGFDVSAETGLSAGEAAARLLRHGPNRLPQPQPRSAAACSPSSSRACLCCCLASRRWCRWQPGAWPMRW